MISTVPIRHDPLGCRGASSRLSFRINRQRSCRIIVHIRATAASSAHHPTPPSWEELASRLPSCAAPKRVWDPVRDVAQCRPDGHPPTPSGGAVLYRDRNGWCPYSERVWLGLEFKGVDFDEVLIDNQGAKPQFWYSLAGGTTPVIRWPSGKTQGESMDILLQLDEMFPECEAGKRLVPDEPAARARASQIANSLKSVMPRMCRPSSRAAFLYRGSGPVPRLEFESSLDALEAMLAEAGGPFFLGEAFTIADCAWVPFLERFAIQLPLLHDGLNPRDPTRWPCLARWYSALESEIPSYASRVQGDALSWAAVLAVAGYGNAGSAANYRAPAGLSFELGRSVAGLEVWQSYAAGKDWLGNTPAVEAARILVANRKAILTDCIKQCTGEVDELQVDMALRACSELILEQSAGQGGAGGDGVISGGIEGEACSAVATVAKYLHTRICVPRDMGRLPADCYHAALTLLIKEERQ